LKTRLKVCGITRIEDALSAVENGADALGFVFYKKSPRYIEPKSAAEIISKLPPFVTTVGLFVNETQVTIDLVSHTSGIDVLQFHGEESPEFCSEQKKRVLKAIPVSSSDDIKSIDKYKCSILLDAKAPKGIYGGAGKTFDWSLLDNLDHNFPLVLAGGLSTQNINTALALRHWYGVDVSSGVESSKGIKDRIKMQQFAEIVHQYNCKV